MNAALLICYAQCFLILSPDSKKKICKNTDFAKSNWRIFAKINFSNNELTTYLCLLILAFCLTMSMFNCNILNNFHRWEIIKLSSYSDFHDIVYMMHIYGNTDLTFLIYVIKVNMYKQFTIKYIQLKFNYHSTIQEHANNKLELVFIKHYAPNSFPLTVSSHHVLFVKRLPKFSKGHNFGKIRWFFFFNLIG